MKKMTGRYSLLFLLLFFSQYVPAQLTDPATGRVMDELLVRLEENTGINTILDRANRQQAASVVHQRTVARRYNIHLLRFNPAAWPGETLLEWLGRQKEVQAAQYNYAVEFRQEPNDPDYDRQWGAARIGAQEVWDLTTGGVTANGDTIVVCILDSGFDISHADLKDNLWRNPGEIPGDGQDNDGNGLPDDIYGWNYIDDNNEIKANSHGLAVAGLIGATGNNGLGISGINWNVRLMFHIIEYVDEIISALEYTIVQRERYNESKGQEGAFVAVVNTSFGLPIPTFCDEQPVWGGMYDLMGNVGILSGAATINQNVDVDAEGDMPTSCESDFIITVTNLTPDDEKFYSAGYGLRSIDMAAPGEGSYSLGLFNRYGAFGGNSAAAPHLSGAIALLYSLPCEELAADALAKPRETAQLIRSVLLDGVEPLESLEGITATGGLLNVFNAMELINKACGGSAGPMEILRIFPNPAASGFTIEYETPDFERYDFRIYNALGQLIYRNTETPNRFATKRLDIDSRNWAPGVYFVAIQRGKEQEVKPVLVKAR